ncbi:hypothetical protein [uncultured Methanospirillum sp.]|uniref:hypothetical protein n=1 Tax=uncultured Methanospirillum sp. TaxID=262503 RepID=UPI0029C7C897|nr:hypothetical protein [uncultured Methanospirillum sp.]
MTMLKRKWQLMLKSFCLIVILIIARIIIDYYSLDIITINSVTSALVTGVIFTIAVIFTGTLTDYKESEKIPGELAASIKSLYHDICMFPTVKPELTDRFRSHIRDLHREVVDNFRSNNWDLISLNQATDQINQDISALSIENVAPPILVKMRNELTIIDKTFNRIKQIKDTDFIPAAYAISEMAISFVILILLFIKSDSLVESVLLIAAITAMITGLFSLIKDMDDPFEVGVGSSADVDLFLLFDLDQYLKE